MLLGRSFRRQPAMIPFHSAWFGPLPALSLACNAAEDRRQWTVYIAQDKHLDYGWCGSTTEIELPMAALLDYHLDAAERDETRWNLDGTLGKKFIAVIADNPVSHVCGMRSARAGLATRATTPCCCGASWTQKRR